MCYFKHMYKLSHTTRLITPEIPIRQKPGADMGCNHDLVMMTFKPTKVEKSKSN